MSPILQHLPPNRFLAFGTPSGQGSKSLVRTRRGVPLMLEASRNLKPWRAAIARAATAAKVPKRDGPVVVEMTVRWPRPASHFTKSGALKPCAPPFPMKIDADKLARAILDAMTGIAYVDDRLVVRESCGREWCEEGVEAHAEIEIRDAR
jgi:crossover junction endodeoxyribonuclease RusA